MFGVDQATLTSMGVLGAIVVAGSLILYRPLLALSFSPAKAETLGMSPRFTHAALLVLIATAVIGSFQAVGTLLVFGLLVGPPATAALLARTVPQMFALSVTLAAFAVWLGLTLSYHWGTAGSATMALVAIAVFFLVLALTRITQVIRSAPAKAVTA